MGEEGKRKKLLRAAFVGLDQISRYYTRYEIQGVQSLNVKSMAKAHVCMLRGYV